jgi:hypothetical protein
MTTDRQRAVVSELWQKAGELYHMEGKTPASMAAVSAWWSAHKALKGLC